MLNDKYFELELRTRHQDLLHEAQQCRLARAAQTPQRRPSVGMRLIHAVTAVAAIVRARSRRRTLAARTARLEKMRTLL